jgi:hypothetical protein
MFNARVFRQCKSTALQKIAVSPFANRYSPLAIRRRFGSAGASPYQRRMNSALIKSVINHWLKPVAWTEKS